MTTARDITVTVWQHLSGTTWADIGSIETWSALSRETRHLQPGPWSLSLPLDAETLKLTADDAKQYLITFGFRDEETTGVIEHVGPAQAETGEITLEVSGLDAMTLLGDVLCWPKPASALSAQDIAHYTASGPGETVLQNMIAVNTSRLYGSGAVYSMKVAPSQGRGTTQSINQRFGNLLEVVTRKCEAAGLGVRVGLVRQAPGSTRADLTVEFYEPRDLSARVFLSHNIGTLQSWSQADDAPTATRSVTGGGGTGTDRVFRSRIRTDAETEWGRRRERFIDARDTTNATELDTRADEELDGAVAQSAFDLEAVDSVGMRYGEHFTLGDSVTIEIATGVDDEGISKVDRLNAVILTSDPDVKVQLRPGNPDSPDPLFKQAAIVRALGQQVRALRLEE